MEFFISDLERIEFYERWLKERDCILETSVIYDLDNGLPHRMDNELDLIKWMLRRADDEGFITAKTSEEAE